MAFEKVQVADAYDQFVDADESMVGGGRVSETLDSLSHLVFMDEGDAGLVRLYAHQLEDRLFALSAVLNSTDPNMRAVRARLCN
jgi:hypothetical protein